MTGAVEDVSEACALTGHIVELCTVPEGVDRNASSVDLRDPQRRVPCWSIRIAICSVDTSHGKADVRHARFACLESGIRIYDLRAERQSGCGRCGADQEGPYRCN